MMGERDTYRIVVDRHPVCAKTPCPVCGSERVEVVPDGCAYSSAARWYCAECQALWHFEKEVDVTPADHIRAVICEYAPRLTTQEATLLCLNALNDVFSPPEAPKIFEAIDTFLNDRGGYVDG